MNAPKKRLKAAESRRALLDAGLQLLKSRGVAPGLDRVTLKEAIELSGVPRSTAYRLYEGGRGQLEEFRADLLTDLDVVEVQPSVDAVEDTITELAPLIDSKDSVKLAFALREIIRVGTNRNLETLMGSLEWRLFMSSLASLGTGAEADTKMNESFRLSARQFGEEYTALFVDLLGVFGLRGRSHHTIEELAVVIAAIAEGVALRHPIDSRLGAIKRPTGVDGELQSWNAAGCALETLLLTWLEADPAAEASADLGTWTHWT